MSAETGERLRELPSAPPVPAAPAAPDRLSCSSAVGESRGSPGRDRHDIKAGDEKLPASVRAVRCVLWMAETYPGGRRRRVTLDDVSS